MVLFFFLENEKREPKKTFFVFPYIIQSSSIYVKCPPILQTVADFAIEGHVQTFSGCPQYRTSRKKLVLAVSRGGCQYRREALMGRQKSNIILDSVSGATCSKCAGTNIGLEGGYLPSNLGR